MKKVFTKTLAYGLALALTIGFMPMVNAAQSINTDHWSNEAITYGIRHSYLRGDENGDIDPDKTMTRAEFVTYMLRVIGKQPMGASTYTDVPQDAWFAMSVAAATIEGLVSGFGDGTFRPHQVINRQEAITIMARAWNVTFTQQIELPFADLDWVDDWALPHVRAMVERNWIRGATGSDGRMWLNPDKPITFGEVSQIVFNRSQRHGSNVIVVLPSSSLTLTADSAGRGGDRRVINLKAGANYRVYWMNRSTPVFIGVFAADATGAISGNLGSYGRLNNSRTYRVWEVGPKYVLEVLIEEAEELVETDWEPAEWALLLVALGEAQDVLADFDATQNEIDYAYENLRNAIDALVPMP
jgi:hypothetical protein